MVRRDKIKPLDLHIEPSFVLALHRVDAFHRAPGRRQRAEARVFEGLAGGELGLLADDAVTDDLFALAGGIDDGPAAAQELRPAVALVGDRDAISKDIASLGRVGVLVDEPRRDAYAHAVVEGDRSERFFGGLGHGCSRWQGRIGTAIPICFEP